VAIAKGKKIVFLTNSELSADSPADLSLTNLARLAKLSGNHPVILGVAKGAAPKSYEIDGIKILCIANPSSGLDRGEKSTEKINNIAYDAKRVDIHIDYAARAAKLAEIMLEIEPEIIHSYDYGGLELASRAIEDLRVANCCPAWLHSAPKFIAALAAGEDNFARNYVKKEEVLLRQVDAIIVDNAIKAQVYEERYFLPETPSVIADLPSAVSCKKVSKIKIKKALKLKDENALAVYIGDVKRIGAIDSVLKMLADNPQMICAIITGERGHFIENIKDTAREEGVLRRLRIVHPPKSEEIISFISDADFVFAPTMGGKISEYEIPQEIYYAIHANLPIIAAQTESVEALLKEHKFGEIFKQGIYYLLREKIEAVLANSAKYKKNISAALKAQYSPEVQAVSLAEIYANTLLKKTKQGKLAVLHGLTGASGLPWAISRAQRKLGIESDTICMDGNKFNYRADKIIPDTVHSIHGMLNDAVNKYDVFQFIFRPAFWQVTTNDFPTGFDLLNLRAANKHVVMYFMGSEARYHSMYSELCEFDYTKEGPGNVAKFPEEAQRRMMKYMRGVASKIAVCDAEMQTYIPDARIIERAIDLENYKYIGAGSTGFEPLVLHAPSRRIVKGTDYVEKAVEELREEGLKFRFQMIEGMTHEKAIEAYKESDILVDQLRIGWYGFLSVEAMAMGKAVICYLRDDLLHHFGEDGPPLAVADPNTFKDTLRNLILDKQARRELGMKARAFCEKMHDSRVVARKFMELYEDCEKDANPVDVAAVTEFMQYQRERYRNVITENNHRFMKFSTKSNNLKAKLAKEKLQNA